MSMFRSFSRFWNEHGFSVLVISTIIFFLLYWLFFTRHKSKGTYSTSYYYDPKTSKISMKIEPRWEKESTTSTSSTGDRNSQTSSSSSRRVTQMSKGEKICKHYLEYIFERPFTKCRPPFLYNSVTNDFLELDMYNPELNVACEYNGKQHYEYIPFLHGNSRTNFHNQLYRDKMKKELCEKHGIQFIVVPYTIPSEKIPEFLKQEIRRLKIQGVKKST